MKRLLFVGASPAGWYPLNLAREYSEVVSAIRSSKHRDHVELIAPDLQVGIGGLAQALAQHPPDLLHVSAHGDRRTQGEALMLSSSQDSPQRLEAELLSSLLAEYRGRIRVLFVNACDSALLAETLASKVDCAIGIEGNIHDSDATKFSAAFYRALGDGWSVKSAFGLAAKEVREGGCVPKLFDPEQRAQSLVLSHRRNSRKVLLGAAPLGLVLAAAWWWQSHPTGKTVESLGSVAPGSAALSSVVSASAALSSVVSASAALSSHAVVEGLAHRVAQDRVSPAPVRAQSAGAAAAVERAERVNPENIYVMAEREGKHVPIDAEHPFILGDRYGIYVRVDEALSGLLLQLGSDGHLTRLYPPSGEMRLLPDREQRIPPRSSGDFEVTSESSSERLVLVLAAAEFQAPQVSDLTRWLRQQADWPPDWQLGEQALAANPTATPFRLRGSTFIPRPQRRADFANLAQVHFLELRQAR